MHGSSLTSGLLRPLIGGVNAMERFNAARNPFREGSQYGWVWVVLAVVALAATAGVSVYLILRKAKQLPAAQAAFDRLAAQAGLSPEERKLLASIAKLAGLKRPEKIFTQQPAFEQGVVGLIESGRLDGMSEEARNRTSALLISLRGKLGFHEPAGPGAGKPPSSRQIPEGATLSIIAPGGRGSFDAVVMGSSAKALEIEPAMPIRCRRGEVWLVRHSDGAKVWEFEAPAIRNSGNKILLGHSEQLRLHNRRRFERIALQRPAQVAPLPFVRTRAEGQAPQFHKASLVEIAGPGLKLEAPIQVQSEDRLLVAFPLRGGKVVEGVAKVRRLLPKREDRSVFGAELIGLTAHELAELQAETEASAEDQRTKAAPPKTKDWKAPAARESQDVRSH